MRAADLKAGQEVYVPRHDGFFRLTADPTTHPRSRNVVVLHLEGLSRPEYRLADIDVLVRPPAG